jgi:putative acetyltransferase
MTDKAPLSFTLRPLNAADMPALADMWVESWRAVFPDIDFDARRKWFHDRMAAHGAVGACAIVAEGEDALLGFLTLDTATHFIDQLAAAPRAQGRGVAQALLTEARRLSPQRLRLDVNEGNARALRFYLREGFRMTGEGVNETSGLKLLRLEWRP